MEQDNPNYIPINDYVKNEDGSFYCMDFKVTHWMPLPKPPKEQGE